MPPSAGSTSGYFSRLELDNFKSWKGRHSVGPFHDGFTAVIGSNGAGKSNLMDAISFVTGVKAKRLRGDQLKDLIYDGDQRAAAEDRKMKVTMVYTCGHDELSNKRAGDEIVFTRSVSYSTPGSNYELQGKRVTYEEYEAMFSKLNVLVNARNFLIFQGDVEATAAKTPQELSLFFEQVSGSDSFKDEYEKLAEEKKRLEEIALEKIHLAKEAKLERKEAKELKDEKEHFDDLTQEKETVRVELALFKLREAGRAMENAQTSLEKIQAKAEEAERVEKAMDEERKKAAAESSSKGRELSKAEKAVLVASKAASSVNAEHAKKLEAFNREKSKKKDAESALKTAKENLERHEGEVAATRKQIAEIEARKVELEKALQKLDDEEDSANQKLTKEERAEMERLRAEADRENAELKSEEERLAREAEACRSRHALAVANVKQTAQRAKEAQDELEALEAKREKLEQHTIPQQKQKVTELANQINERKAAEAKAETELVEKKRLLDEAKRILSTSKARTAENKRSQKLGETVKDLQRKFPGVRGRLMTLMTVPQHKYRLAVDTAFGRHMDSIVVDKESTAVECIKYLRENRAGTATFLPLDTIQPKEIAEDKRRAANGPIKLCIHLIQYDKDIEKAVQFAAGDSMVCETLEQARDLCFKKHIRVKAVTINGHLISPRGEMTGGAMGEQGRVDRFAENEAAQAKEKKEQFEREVTDLERVLDRLRTEALQPHPELKRAETGLELAQAELKGTKAKFPERQERAKKAKAAHAEAEEKVKSLEAELATLTSELDKVRVKISRKEDQLFKGGKGVRQLIDRKTEEKRQQLQADLGELRTQLDKLQSHLRYLESQSRAATVAECESTLKARVESMAKLEKELKEVKEELDKAESALKQAEATKAACEEEAKQAQDHVKECQKRLAEVTKERTDHQREIVRLEGEVQKARTEQHEIIKQAQLDGLTLPRKTDKKEEDLSAEEEEGASGDEYDFSALRRSAYKSIKDFEDRIKQIERELTEIMPNRAADTRYQEASEKLKTTDAHVREAREAAASAAAGFDVIRKKRMESFMNMFTHVAQRIEGVYKALTRGPDAPMGGSAFLSLIDPEDPFNGGIKFECMPPLKRFRAKEQLSGGEKTVAALALLFAIHSYRPSPFFVMDEVDAALDNDNVERVSEYIRSRTRIDQGGHKDEDEERRFQCLVISLKDAFYTKAEKLVGVYRNDETDSSSCLTLDLSVYPTE